MYFQWFAFAPGHWINVANWIKLNLRSEDACLKISFRSGFVFWRMPSFDVGVTSYLSHQSELDVPPSKVVPRLSTPSKYSRFRPFVFSLRSSQALVVEYHSRLWKIEDQTWSIGVFPGKIYLLLLGQLQFKLARSRSTVCEGHVEQEKRKGTL